MSARVRPAEQRARDHAAVVEDHRSDHGGRGGVSPAALCVRAVGSVGTGGSSVRRGDGGAKLSCRFRRHGAGHGLGVRHQHGHSHWRGQRCRWNASTRSTGTQRDGERGLGGVTLIWVERKAGVRRSPGDGRTIIGCAHGAAAPRARPRRHRRQAGATWRSVTTLPTSAVATITRARRLVRVGDRSRWYRSTAQDPRLHVARPDLGAGEQIAWPPEHRMARPQLALRSVGSNRPLATVIVVATARATPRPRATERGERRNVADPPSRRTGRGAGKERKTTGEGGLRSSCLASSLPASSSCQSSDRSTSARRGVGLRGTGLAGCPRARSWTPTRSSPRFRASKAVVVASRRRSPLAVTEPRTLFNLPPPSLCGARQLLREQLSTPQCWSHLVQQYS